MAEKTNAVRLCDSHQVSYKLYEYDSSDGALDGISVAVKIGKMPEEVFKTLVTIGQSKNHYVFVIPVDKELDLKKGAKTVGEKYIEMIPVKDLLKTTGYVKGGCSPIGMKKSFVTVFDETLMLLDEVVFSAGKIGLQLCVPINELDKILEYTLADLV